MSTKKYVDDLIKDLDTRMTENRKKKNKNEFLYNLGTIFVGVLGVCLLFGNPWFGIPLIGGAIALQLDRKLNAKNLDASYQALSAQSTHLNKLLQGGIDISTTAMNNRKSAINRMKSTKKTRESEYLSSKSTHQFGNMLVALTVALSGLVTNPFIALGALGCVAIKHICDRKYPVCHKAYEEILRDINNTANDYNIGASVIQNRRGSSTASSLGHANQMGKTKTISQFISPKSSSSSKTCTISQIVPPKSQDTFEESHADMICQLADPEKCESDDRICQLGAPKKRESDDRICRLGAPSISREDEEAVDSYIASLDGVGDDTNGIQKRKS